MRLAIWLVNSFKNSLANWVKYACHLWKAGSACTHFWKRISLSGNELINVFCLGWFKIRLKSVI